MRAKSLNSSMMLAQRAQLVEDGVAGVARTASAEAPGLLVLGQRPAQRLDRELDREDRVLQLVRQPARHLAPGGDALRLQQPLARDVSSSAVIALKARARSPISSRPRRGDRRVRVARRHRARRSRPAPPPAARCGRQHERRQRARPPARPPRSRGAGAARSPLDRVERGAGRGRHDPEVGVQRARGPALGRVPRAALASARAVAGAAKGAVHAARPGEPARRSSGRAAVPQSATSTPARLESSWQKAASRNGPAAHDHQPAAPFARRLRP